MRASIDRPVMPPRAWWLAAIGALAVIALVVGTVVGVGGNSQHPLRGELGARSLAPSTTPPCSDSSVAFRLAQQPAANSGEGAVYVSVRARPGIACSVDGYPTVHVVSGNVRSVLVSTGGAPVMHSPRPIREVVRPNDPVFFGIGWYTQTPDAARPSLCVRASAVRVSLGQGTGAVIPTAPVKICDPQAKPHVFVSSMLHNGQFPDVELTW
jgi:hypothetical protein